MAVLELRGLSKHFGRNLAVNDLDLVVKEGQIRGLIGPNGSGKTTLLKLISGIRHPQQGSVELFGSPVQNFKPRDLAKKIAFVSHREAVISCFQ